MNEFAFSARHIGPRAEDCDAMLKTLGVESLDTLIAEAVPRDIRLAAPLALPPALSEQAALAELKAIMSRNRVLKSFIGQGYHGTFVPPVIQRNLLENPAWYTAYTPYQAEISQGRLELLFHFQTLVCELTGLPVAAASLLDEATALAEAVGIAVRFFRDKRKRVVLAGQLHPQLLDVVVTRAETQAIAVTAGEITDDTAAVIVPWPDTYGVFSDGSAIIRTAKAKGALVIAAADPLALTVLGAPAAWGADIVVGSMQRFGVPMGFGGPHAAYLAVSRAARPPAAGRADSPAGLPFQSRGHSAGLHRGRATFF